MSYSFFGTYSSTSYKILESLNYDDSFNKFVTVEINKYCTVKTTETCTEFKRLNEGSYIINIMYNENSNDVEYFEDDKKIIFEYGKDIKKHDSEYILSRKKPYIKLEIDLEDKTVTLFANKKQTYYLSLENSNEFSSKPMVTVYEENPVIESTQIKIEQLLSEYKKKIENVY